MFVQSKPLCFTIRLQSAISLQIFFFRFTKPKHTEEAIEVIKRSISLEKVIFEDCEYDSPVPLVAEAQLWSRLLPYVANFGKNVKLLAFSQIKWIRDKELLGQYRFEGNSCGRENENVVKFVKDFMPNLKYFYFDSLCGISGASMKNFFEEHTDKIGLNLCFDGNGSNLDSLPNFNHLEVLGITSTNLVGV